METREEVVKIKQEWRLPLDEPTSNTKTNKDIRDKPSSNIETRKDVINTETRGNIVKIKW